MEKIIKNDALIPLSDRLQEISSMYDVSVVLVVGANYELLKEADTIILVNDYRLNLLKQKNRKSQEVVVNNGNILEKKVSLDIYDDGKINVEVNPLGYITIGKEAIKVNAIKSICSYEQLCSIGYLLGKLYWKLGNGNENNDIYGLIQEAISKLDGNGLNELAVGKEGYWLELPRIFDVFAVINRLPAH